MMRTFRHWTPRYLFARTVEKVYRKRNPDLPWLTQHANKILVDLIKPSDVGLEFGSGVSTVWFAKRVSFLTSIEHNPTWYQKVSGLLAEKGLANVEYLLHERTGEIVDMDHLPAYVQAVQHIRPASLDFALVDGIYRDACSLVSLDKLKPGGVFILDNANLHLPCRSHSPNSRTANQGPAAPLWQQFLDAVAGWQTIWTSNAVSDTAFYFKPN